MGNIPNAHESPRLCNGVLYWYCGDTFDLDIALNIKDQNGEPYNIKPTDIVSLSFRNFRSETIAEYSFTTASGITGNTLNLKIDETETVKFPRGEYHYSCKLIWEQTTTIVDGNKVVVQ